MEVQLTAVFRKVPEGYVGFVEELPGANTQASTLEEALESLLEAVDSAGKTRSQRGSTCATGCYSPVIVRQQPSAVSAIK